MDAQEYIWNDKEKTRKNRELVKNKQNIEGYPSVWDVNMKKVECPYLRKHAGYVPSVDEYFADYRCDLTERACTLEYEGVCEEWDEIKDEWQREST